MQKSSSIKCLAVLGAAAWWAPAVSQAVEVTVQNDSLMGGGTGSVQAGFVAGESAAAWLTSPCNGNIVAVQVFWRSLFGGEPLSVEDSITIFAGATFPTPGAQLVQLEGPVMTDGVINEFRFLDENMTIPLSVPITSGQTFVVSFRFANSPGPFGPSVVTDSGCQAGRNAIFAVPGGWLNACALGVSGDFVIRAVIDCNPTQACCFMPSGCLDLSASDCGLAGGDPQGAGTNCASTVCFPTGACCNPDATCDDDIDPLDCASTGGVYQGDGSQCSSVTCPAPSGACCLSTGGCLQLSQADCGVIPNSQWAGPVTACPDDCVAPDCVTVEDCCDQNTDQIRDDGCTWCACDTGTCSETDVIFGDLGGSFGACLPDGFANLFDRTHALSCFAGTSSCDELNLDAGGSFGACNPDGFCNLFDVSHVLTAFSGTNPCTCPPGPAPQPVVHTAGSAGLVLSAERGFVAPGGRVAVRAFIDAPLADLQAYQLHLAAEGGARGRLELVDIHIEQRKDAVFAGRPDRFEAFNAARNQMLAGLEQGGLATTARGYLATFVYQASTDAAGVFVIDVLHHEDAGEQTFLVSNFHDRIAVSGARPAVLRIR